MAMKNIAQGGKFKRIDLQTRLTEIMNLATAAMTIGKPPIDMAESLAEEGNGLVTAKFTVDALRGVQNNHDLAKRLSPLTFAELFSEMVKARHAWFVYHEERETNPWSVASHSWLAQAVDRFLAVAWFWKGSEFLFMVDAEQRTKDAKEQGELDLVEDGTATLGTTAVSSLIRGFDGGKVWNLSGDTYEDDVEPITDGEEDEVMGGTEVP